MKLKVGDRVILQSVEEMIECCNISNIKDVRRNFNEKMRKVVNKYAGLLVTIDFEFGSDGLYDVYGIKEDPRRWQWEERWFKPKAEILRI